MTMLSNTIEKTTRAIKEAMTNNCLYVYHVWGDGLRARICDARVKKGQLQVKHLQFGTWVSVSESETIIQ